MQKHEFTKLLRDHKLTLKELKAEYDEKKAKSATHALTDGAKAPAKGADMASPDAVMAHGLNVQQAGTASLQRTLIVIHETKDVAIDTVAKLDANTHQIEGMHGQHAQVPQPRHPTVPVSRVLVIVRCSALSLCPPLLSVCRPYCGDRHDAGSLHQGDQSYGAQNGHGQGHLGDDVSHRRGGRYHSRVETLQIELIIIQQRRSDDTTQHDNRNQLKSMKLSDAACQLVFVQYFTVTQFTNLAILIFS